MKKIFRMAMVFALAGAALLTGCTKDYAEDIAALQNKITELEGKVGDLQNAINAGCVITGIEKNKDGYIISTSDGNKYPVTNGIDGAPGKPGAPGDPGDPGKSAYDLAKEAGFTGDLAAWLESLKGADGKSAYDIAKENGFTGDYAAWLASLQGENGKSAYELAKEAGLPNTDTLEAWLDSLYPVITIQDVDGEPYWFINGEKTDYVAKGEKGDKGEPGNFWKYDAENFKWVEYKINAEGAEEATGKEEDVFPNGYKPLTASWAEDKLTFSNIAVLDEDGKVSDYKTITIDLRTSLKSIVSIPDLYYAGIEAFKYYYLEYLAGGVIKNDYKTVDDLGNEAKISKKDTLEFPATAKYYFAGSHAIAHYFVNPESYDLENAKFDLYPDDKVYMPLFGTKHEGWKPNFISAKREADNPKIVDVEYTISDADCLEPCIEKYNAYMESLEEEDTQDEITADTPTMNANEAAAVDCDVDVSIMHLEGVDQVNNNKIVASDFAAVVPMKQGIAALAFSLPGYPGDAEACDVNYDHLWGSAHAAAEHAPSVYVYYNGGPQDINYVGVHMQDADETMPRTMGEKHVLKTLKQLKATYPNFDIKYEFVPCKLGLKDTQEEAYGILIPPAQSKTGEWQFNPAFADTDGNPVAIDSVDPEAREKNGISAKGRRPIVLATLVDNDNKDAKGNPAIVLAGYFKIHITDVPPVTPPEGPDEFTGKLLKDFSGKAFTFDCATDSLATVWTDFSEPVLENFLNIDYDTWVATYTWVSGTNAPHYNTYTWSGDKKDAGKLTYDATLGYNKYGTIRYDKDTGLSAINDVFHVIVDWRQKQNIIKDFPEKQVTLWARFDNKKVKTEHLFFGVTIKVNDHPDASFVQHNPKYWWDELTSEYGDKQPETVRRNVFVPNVWLSSNAEDDNDKVEIYKKYLTEDWIENVIKIKVDGKTYIPRDKDHELIDTYEDNIFYKFQFTKPDPNDAHSQPYIKGRQWTTNETLDTLYWQHPDSVNRTPVVALNDTSGLVTYLWDEDSTYVSKYLLNLWAPYSENLNEILYGNVDLIAYSYVEEESDEPRNEPEYCYIELGREQIHVRFLRPITVEYESKGVLRDAYPTGDAIYLGELFRAHDWNHVEYPDGYLIFDWNSKLGKFETCYFPEQHNKATAKVEWYGYYGFSSLSIDMDKILTDQTGTWEFIKTVNPAARFWLAPANNHKDYTTYSNSVDISDLDNLSDIVFVYYNNEGVVDNFHLKIPISITYKWGIYTDYVTVPVKGTNYYKVEE